MKTRDALIETAHSPQHNSAWHDGSNTNDWLHLTCPYALATVNTVPTNTDYSHSVMTASELGNS